MPRISDISALELLDGRGDPTLEVTITLDSGHEGRALVPAGKSKGKHEASELRDGDQERFGGKGVLKAAHNVGEVIRPAILGRDPTQQQEIDLALMEIDGRPGYARLGSNAATGVSLACARASAASEGLELYAYLNPAGPYVLPMPQVSIIGGGLHADNPLEFQDFLVVPVGAETFSDAVHMAWKVRQAAGERVRQLGHPTLIGDGGGFAPPLRRNRLAADLVLGAIEDAGYRPGVDMEMAIDVAANHFREGDGYVVDGRLVATSELEALLENWCDTYPLRSIEDPFDEDDLESWKRLTDVIGKNIQLVGDDLFVTNPQRLAVGVEQGLANAILVKPNQIGTLSETLKVIDQAKVSGFGTVVSIRSGETEDPFIADLSVATNAGQIKLGSLARASRTAKFNQLLRIEKMLGTRAQFASGPTANKLSVT